MNLPNTPDPIPGNQIGESFFALLAAQRALQPTRHEATARRLREFGSRLRSDVDRLAWCVSGEAESCRETALRDGYNALRGLQSAATALDLPLVASYCDSLRQVFALLFDEHLVLAPRLSVALLACFDGLERCAAFAASTEAAAVAQTLAEPLRRMQALLRAAKPDAGDEPGDLTADALLGQIVGAFAEESVAMLRSLPHDLVANPAPEASLRRVLGTVSTIQLASEMFGFGNLQRFAAGVEEAVAAVAGGRFAITPRVAESLSAALRTMTERIPEVAAAPPSSELSRHESEVLRALWAAVDESVLAADDGRALCCAAEGREQLQPLVAKFVEASTELIEDVVAKLTASLESGELPVRAIFAAVHAVGGMAGSLGFAPARRYAVALEDFLLRVESEHADVSRSVAYELRLCLDLLQEHVTLSRLLPPSLPLVPEEQQLLRDLYAALDWEPPRSREQSLWQRLAGGLRFGDRGALTAWVADLRQLAGRRASSAEAVREALHTVESLLGPPGSEHRHCRPLHALEEG